MPDDAPLIQYVNPKNARPYIRSYTKNARHPTEAQLDNQRRFGEIVRSQEGITGFAADGTPIVANEVSKRHSRELANVPARKDRPLTKTEEEIVNYWLPRIASAVASSRYRRRMEYEIID